MADTEAASERQGAFTGNGEKRCRSGKKQIKAKGARALPVWCLVVFQAAH